MNVITIGTFDILHRGHVHLLEMCRRIANGSSLTIGVNTDEFVERMKGQPPVNTLEDRMAMLSLFGFREQEAVIPHGGDTAQWIGQRHRLGMTALVVGSDWAHKDYYAQLGVSREQLAALDIFVLYVDNVPGYSDTLIREKIRRRETT